MAGKTQAPPIDVRLGDIVLYALPQQAEVPAMIVAIGPSEPDNPCPVDLHLFSSVNVANKAMLETNVIQLDPYHFYVGNVSYNPAPEWKQHTWRTRD